MSRSELLLELHSIGAIQFGTFKLRSGIESPFYLDFRKVVSYPKLLRSLCNELWTNIKKEDFDFLLGVPYAALSFAAGISVIEDVATLTMRKERKKYGGKKLIEGVYKSGDKCLVIEDVVTSGISLLETFEQLEEEGLKPISAIVIMDRQQGGMQILTEKGYKVKALFSLNEALDLYLEKGKLDQNGYDSVKKFVEENQLNSKPSPTPKDDSQIVSYEDIISSTQHPKAKLLAEIALEKQSNLICSADLTSSADLLQLAEEVGPHICALKTHVDIVGDFNSDTIKGLKAAAKKHKFLLFEDRKFADIGNTVQLQYQAKPYSISSWADLITVHVVAGESSVISLNEVNPDVGMLLIAQMSTKDTLTDDNYIKAAAEIAEAHPQAVIGAVCQQRLFNSAGQIHFTPGINLNTTGDNKGQTYNTPEIAIRDRGTQFMIVGRGIYKANNAEEAAKTYKEAGWDAYSKLKNTNA